jgi:hypothetical protein
MSGTVRRSQGVDYALGIALGIVLGIAVVAGFVFLGSEGTIDAPRISGVDTGKPQPREKPLPPSPGNPFR